MQDDRIAGERLVARILEQDPTFGSAGYLARLPPMLNLVELLERLHTPGSAIGSVSRRTPS